MTAEEMIRLLDELATRLEGPARYAFDLAVKQVWIEGIVGLVLGLLLTVAPPLGVRWLIRKLRTVKDTAFTDVKGDLVMGYLMSSILGGVWLVLLGFVWQGVLSRLLNPEWAALERLITTLKP